MDTLKGAALKGIVRPISFVVGFLLITAVLAWVGISAQMASPHKAPTASAAPSRVDVLITQHDCWTGASPYGDRVKPAHAVYTLPGKHAAYGPARVGFNIWLADKPGVLHAFCR